MITQGRFMRAILRATGRADKVGIVAWREREVKIFFASRWRWFRASRRARAVRFSPRPSHFFAYARAAAAREMNARRAPKKCRARQKSVDSNFFDY
jgi:hypothetical protein